MSDVVENEDEFSWEVTVTLQGAEVAVPLKKSVIKQEIEDQISIKGAHRKAILRSTIKKFTSGLKKGPENLKADALKEFQWNAFILLVDDVIANRHLAMRSDAVLIEEALKDPRLVSPQD
ncbi:hypothetical protein O4H49_07770 [Kiloniella laminariae]|uniref:Uncharacterized protein n=1 Tax=Kiloniella laminariae TaxID=454162 RepID=A0ABT4LHT8_9PROT|nr:hypothetical protein [Kiloniella laminariae]MCZ4280672.1 hypothetical protein [Kiloniella laminariae]